MAYDETPTAKGSIMITLIVAIVLSFIAGMLVNHVATRKANAKLIDSVKEAVDAKAFHEGFNLGWKHASMDWTNIRTNYEKFMNPDKK
jgi:flagellar basal body-associated protein FliL